jgi:hypothetical protein
MALYIKAAVWSRAGAEARPGGGRGLGRGSRAPPLGVGPGISAEEGGGASRQGTRAAEAAATSARFAAQDVWCCPGRGRLPAASEPSCPLLLGLRQFRQVSAQSPGWGEGCLFNQLQLLSTVWGGVSSALWENDHSYSGVSRECPLRRPSPAFAVACALGDASGG